MLDNYWLKDGTMNVSDPIWLIDFSAFGIYIVKVKAISLVKNQWLLWVNSGLKLL